MLRIHTRVVIALLGLSFAIGAATAGLILGLAMERHWFMAGAAAIGFPVMACWAIHGYLTDRRSGVFNG